MFPSKKYLLLLGFLVIVIVLATLFYKKPASNLNHETFQMKTSTFEQKSHKVQPGFLSGEKAHTGMLEFTNGVPVSNKMADAILCADHFNSIDSVDLYMPDMGHGSEPPLVKKYAGVIPKYMQEKAPQNADFGCLTVEKMQLFMPGLWQVRAFYKDGTVGLFDVNLKN